LRFKEAGLKRSWWGALASVVGVVVLLGGCGGSNAPTDNPTPVISNLFPSNITAGSDGFTLAITATTGIISSGRGVTFAYWNGSPRSTTYNPVTNQLQVTIPASDLVTPGSPQVTLWNPPPGGGMSQVAASFTIAPVGNNAPTITDISPTSAKVGGPSFMLTITGNNYAAGDVIAWNGVPLTTSISGNQATATIPAVDISAVGTGSVTVSAPGLVVAAPSVAFPITGSNNPSPSASSVSPSTVAAGGSDFEAVIGGSGFVTSTSAEWSIPPGAAQPLATSVLSGSKLVVLIPAGYIASAGAAEITVTNPPPGGGTSSEVKFTISAASP
jgi:hypothetical protein